MTMTKRRALLSVSDKTGVADFARGLTELGFEVISTGGTAKALSAAGIPNTEVSEITGFPECLDGRVKTLHPAVHGGILAMRDNPSHVEQMESLGISPIDVVAINLYPFKQTIMKPGVSLEEAVENIDVGGPAMLRAAAKNWKDVAVVCDPGDYPAVLEGLSHGSLPRERRFRLAAKVFEHTAAYDALIAGYLHRQNAGSPLFPELLTPTYEKIMDLRYGENPHQKAAYYRETACALDGVLGAAEQLHGKELSYNNIGDAAAALDLLREFPDTAPTAVAIKHANPCGAGMGGSLLDAYTGTYDADPVSIFGGIVAVNREVDAPTARKMSQTFLEIIIAPGFSPEALEILTGKEDIRLLKLPGLASANFSGMMDMKKLPGGLLVQEADLPAPEELRAVTRRAPTDEETRQLLFAWKVVKHVKSNAIVLAKDGRTVGVGPGQTNRITALELAIKYAGEQTQGCVMASDAFFPFSDCVELAAKAGISAIIQPGGALRDADSIKACDEASIAMVFTGRRHFKH